MFTIYHLCRAVRIPIGFYTATGPSLVETADGPRIRWWDGSGPRGGRAHGRTLTERGTAEFLRRRVSLAEHLNEHRAAIEADYGRFVEFHRAANACYDIDPSDVGPHQYY